ncbi:MULTISPECIES: DUF748 domain-containing protein [Methylomonas]|uniref:DUF748 domain-containing protein n=1 Tax=Methylomonas TaxID=416 RepID=UPI0012328A35|nr:DUF748 domain-containing protein [Methylomonas rhizoryzae]
MRQRKTLLLLGGVPLALLALYAAAGYYLVPYWAVNKLPALLSELTGHSVQIQAAHFDPFDLKTDIQGVALTLSDHRTLLNWEELALDIDVVDSIKQRGLTLAYLQLKSPSVNLERLENGRFNFSDLVDQFAQTDPPSATEPVTAEPTTDPLPLFIRQAGIENARIAWLDHQAGQPLAETLAPVDIRVNALSLQPNSPTEILISAQPASGGKIELQSSLDIASLIGKGRLSLQDIELPAIWSLFLQPLTPMQIAQGRLALQVDFSLDAHAPTGLQATLAEGKLNIAELNLHEKAKPDSLVSIADFSVDHIGLDLQRQLVEIGQIHSRGALINAWLQADGKLNYQSLFDADAAPAASQPPPTAAQTGGKAWQIAVDSLDLNGYRIRFTDYTQAKPVAMELGDLHIGLQDYKNKDGLHLPLQFDTRFNHDGSIKLQGDLVLSPFSANWQVAIQNIKLKTFQSYIDPFIKLELVDGNFNTQGHLQMAAAEPLQIVYQGDADIAHLITRDKRKNQDFVKWTHLNLKQMTIDVPKQDYTLGAVNFEQPYVRFIINKDRSNNVDDLLVSRAEPKPHAKAKLKPDKPTSTPIEQARGPVVTIGKIELTQGKSDFADYSLILPFVVKMNDLNGEVDGFSSNTDVSTKLKLRGKVHDLAPVKIQGDYNLQNGDANIVLNFSHLPLPLITPYMAEFAGYKIEKGQMDLDLQYSVKKGQLAAENKIFIDQLTLGEKVENPKAVSLPLELGIALLKDADGKINLDFPITGSLEDPSFSVGSLVTDVFVNLITKTVSAPFKALSSLFDDDADLSVVRFAAGDSDLDVEQTQKLDEIAKALAQKTELVLEIKGIAYETADWPKLRSAVVTDILKKMKSGELRDKGEKIRAEYIELSDGEYKRLLAKFYAEVFPNSIDYSLLGSPRIKNKPDADFYSSAQQELESVMQPEPERLNELAMARANRIAKYLVETAGVDSSRLYILATELNKAENPEGIDAQLSLNVSS